MFARALPIADAVLFEGYVLYPYRATSTKNVAPFSFGTLLPAGPTPHEGSERSFFRCEAIAIGERSTSVRVLVRFLEQTPSGTDGPRGVVHELAMPPVSLDMLIDRPTEIDVREGVLRGHARLSACTVPRGARITLVVENTTACNADAATEALARREPGMLLSFASAHALLGIEGGTWISPTDPGPTHTELVETCANVGVWPVLVGPDVLLASPIILPDQPAIAAESATSMFDGLEIDEILALRILTLTGDEKEQMRAYDPRARALIDRIESLSPAQLARLHGTWRTRELRVGDRVRLAPHAGADAMDFLLAGRAATVAAIQRDVDDRVHVAVTIDDDPGRDLGAEGRKPGHRFYFGADEVERIETEATS